MNPNERSSEGNQEKKILPNEDLPRENKMLIHSLKKRIDEYPIAKDGSSGITFYVHNMDDQKYKHNEISASSLTESYDTLESIVKCLSHTELTYPVGRKAISNSYRPPITSITPITPIGGLPTTDYTLKNNNEYKNSIDSMDDLCSIFSELADDTPIILRDEEFKNHTFINDDTSYMNDLLNDQMFYIPKQSKQLSNFFVEHGCIKNSEPRPSSSGHNRTPITSHDEDGNSSQLSMDIEGHCTRQGDEGNFWETYNFRSYLQKFEVASIFSKKMTELLYERDQIITRYSTSIKEWSSKWKNFLHATKQDAKTPLYVNDRAIITFQLLVERECMRAEHADHDVAMAKSMFCVPLINLTEAILIKDKQKVKFEQFIKYYDKLFLHEVKYWYQKIYNVQRIIEKYKSSRTKLNDFMNRGSKMKSKSATNQEKELHSKCLNQLQEWKKEYLTLNMHKNMFIRRIRILCEHLEKCDYERLTIYKALASQLSASCKENEHFLMIRAQTTSNATNFIPECEVERWSEMYGVKTPFPDEKFEKMYSPEYCLKDPATAPTLSCPKFSPASGQYVKQKRIQQPDKKTSPLRHRPNNSKGN